MAVKEGSTLILGGDLTKPERDILENKLRKTKSQMDRMIRIGGNPYQTYEP